MVDCLHEIGSKKLTGRMVIMTEVSGTDEWT